MPCVAMAHSTKSLNIGLSRRFVLSPSWRRQISECKQCKQNRDEYTAMQSNGPLTQVGFRLSLNGFRKKVSMTKIKIGSKDAEYKVDEGFRWVSCDISTYEGGFQAFFVLVAERSINDKNQHWLKRCGI
jgi:hypothetical protein